MADEQGEKQGDPPPAADPKPPAPEGSVEGSAELADAQARITQLEADVETRNTEGRKYRRQIKDLKAKPADEPPDTNGDEPKGPNPLAAALRRQAFVTEAIRQGVDAEAAKKFADLLGAEAFADVDVDDETGAVHGIDKVVTDALEAMPMLKQSTEPDPAPGTVDGAPGSDGKPSILDALKSREAFKAATATDEGFEALTSRLSRYVTIDPQTGHRIVWNLGTSPNEAHARVRKAQESTLLDRLSGIAPHK